MIEFVRDQQYLEYNLTNKAIDASKYDAMTDQQKEDVTLQYLSFQNYLVVVKVEYLQVKVG